MSTPIANLCAVRGTDYLEVITLATNEGTPVSTNSAQGLFVIREYQRGPIIKELNNASGISFGASTMEVRLTEAELDLILFNTLWYDCFIQLQGDVKRKIARGTFEIE